MDIPREWSFERTDVAKAFDRHVREQLPWYDLATDAVSHIARHYIPEGGLVYDIGAATGNVGRSLAMTLDARNAQIIGIEPSAEMVGAWSGPGSVVQDTAQHYEYQPFDVAVLFLTLMFVPVHERKALLWKLRKQCRPGGAILLFDKMEPGRGYVSSVLWRLTLAGKLAADTSPEQILAKELSLGGVQRPLREADVPVDAIEWFRFADFCGWIVPVDAEHG